MLADQASLSDNKLYWPGTTRDAGEEYDVISSRIMDGVYEKIPNSTVSVFRSKFFPRPLSPQEAHLTYLLPSSVSTILEFIQPPDVVQLASSASRRLREGRSGNGVQFVGPKYLHERLKSHSTPIPAEMLKPKHLQDLINFLLTDDNALDFIDGLRLLPLEDGSYATFGPRSESPSFYVLPLRALKLNVFRPDCLVHRDMQVDRLLKVRELNVQAVNNSNIGNLLTEHVSSSTSPQNLDAATATWIRDFWKVFPLLGISLSAISTYPLIPTSTPGLHHSMNSCRGPTIILARFDFVDEFLSACLTQMGFTLIDADSLPLAVQSELSPASITVDFIASKLLAHPQSLESLFSLLDSNLRLRLTAWILADLSSRNRNDLIAHQNYLQLPLWKSSDGSFVSARDAQMLPPSVPLESVAPFATTTLIGHDSLLSKMDLSPSFGSNSAKMILPSFRKYENRLQQFGLIQKRDLTIAMFKTCVEAFQTATGSDLDLRNRAAILFLVFGEDLPLRVNSSEEYLWKTLENPRFIPRDRSPKPLPGINAEGYVDEDIRFLPDVVAPAQLLRSDLMPVAWTQRVLFSTEPHQRLRMVYPGLGVPTAEEVVNHLKVLAVRVACDHSRNSTVIQHLEKTYQWLNDNADAAAPFLRRCAEKSIPIFLNVDNPRDSAETWVWKPANDILLDSYDTVSLQCPRNFLKSFHALLTAAGAVAIDYGTEVDATYQSPNDEDRLSNLCTAFDSMRKEGIFTDVNFICDAPDDQPLKAHRSYLAAYSTHFREMFSSMFGEAGEASSEHPIVVHVQGTSRSCVEKALDFVYTTQPPAFARTDSDTDIALEMLALANSWYMTELHRVLQNRIIELKMVHPFNVDAVLDDAEKTRATELVDYCKGYIERNMGLVERARQQG
ncbi:hypothetical protein AN958_03415 [Leucoagaricus sp. SymC.cos]|nr:hypothetical protein AN958_03415 [Leucoagaricus sp. SymC.cos]